MHAEVVIAYLLSLTDDGDGVATVKRQRSSDNDQASSTIAAMEKLSVMELILILTLILTLTLTLP